MTAKVVYMYIRMTKKSYQMHHEKELTFHTKRKIMNELYFMDEINL
jgi:hypothetical protein